MSNADGDRKWPLIVALAILGGVICIGIAGAIWRKPAGAGPDAFLEALDLLETKSSPDVLVRQIRSGDPAQQEMALFELALPPRVYSEEVMAALIETAAEGKLGRV